MRKREAITLAVLAIVGGVMTYQAVTATPPEPYVELVGPPTQAPRIETECIRGQYIVVHYDGHGREIRRIDEGKFC